MIAFSIDHHRATSEQLALLSRGWHDIAGLVMKSPSVVGTVVLATCARLEVYVDATQYHPASDAVTEALLITSGMSPAEVADVMQVHRGVAALEHLFSVASGLRSRVIGEDQVVGQVSAALARARAESTATRSLTMAFQNAVRVSRLVRARDGLDRSLIGALLDTIARPDRPNPAGTHDRMTALVIGTGAYARVAVNALLSRGYSSIGVMSPSGRAVTLDGANSVPRDALADHLVTSDVVIGCSGHGTPVVTRELALQVLDLRGRPLVAIDVALRPDIDPALDPHPGMRILRTSDAPAGQGGSGIDDAGRLIAGEARALAPRMTGGELDELITAMRTHVQRLAADEVQRVDDPGHAAAVEHALHRFTQALLHTPTARARESAATERLDGFRHAVGWVFDLEGASP
jgi:glutamyl-tRNA reductase